MKDNPITLTFLGDISLNDEYNQLYQKGEKPFEDVKDILFNSDFVVGNLECLAKGDKGENLLKKPRLKTNLETLNYLKDINLGLALLAHNHVYDNLEDGFLKTINFLDENNIAHIGAGLSPEEAAKPFIKDFNGTKVCILNYVTHDTNPSLPKDATVYPNWFEENRVISDIKKYKSQVDNIILCLHWGGECEGGYYPDWKQPEIAHKLIDAGADIIVGGHSHTLQPFEKYKEKFIYYSLGNFCFSDIISDGKLIEIERGKRTEGAILQVPLETNQSNKIIPIENQNLFIYHNEKVKFKLYKRLRWFKIIKRYRLIWWLYYLKYRYFDPILFYFWGNNRNVYKQLKKLNFGKIRRFLKL